MTPSSSAPDQRQKVALRKRSAPHSLAARRAAFAAQMREMALSDLEQVAERLRSLHVELERKDARKWTQQQVAQKAGIPYRTYQSWLGAKNENEDGAGYDKLAAFYSRRLGRKITRSWIVFGDGEPAKAPLGGLSAPASQSDLADRLEWIESALSALLAERGLELDVPPSEQDRPRRTGS